MNRCDVCRVKESVEKSNEPACCAWYLENVVVGNKTVDNCTAFEPAESLVKIVSTICPNLTGHILRWIDSNQFIAVVTSRDGTVGEMICHKDCWAII